MGEGDEGGGGGGGGGGGVGGVRVETGAAEMDCVSETFARAVHACYAAVAFICP